MRLKSLLLITALAAPGLGCSGLCGIGDPVLGIRSPFRLDNEPSTAAGPRMMMVPQYAVPTFSAPAGGCFAPGYSVAAPPPVSAPIPCP